MNDHRQIALTCLGHVLIGIDGKIEPDEKTELERLLQTSGFSTETNLSLETLSHRDAYQKGVDHLLQCTRDEQLQLLARLLHLSQVDGGVHVKETKLLLQAIDETGIPFDDVASAANNVN